ncbi:MAG TPA: M23 family metallopeptidase [Anaeromyxobacteraceae bacterium]|nr:M23 family metallopeptidase [Anaeromyxobacteraceae bacterium]
MQPARARPGDAFLVLVRGAASPPSARAAGRELAVWPVPGGFAAVGGLPVETAAGPLEVEVFLPIDGGEPVRLAPRLEVEAPGFPHRALTVDQRFVRPPPEEVQRRIEADRAAFARAFDQPAAPPVFDAPFAWPRRDRVTAGYGEQRTMNGVKPSQHYGLDLAGAVGAPVASAQDGRVVLARDCWASGQSVVVWHGAGLFTTYFHLSRTLVREGDVVRRGQRLGLVGATGRASGPHLHWGVRVGDLYVDPRSVLRLPLPEGRAATR